MVKKFWRLIICSGIVVSILAAVVSLIGAKLLQDRKANRGQRRIACNYTSLEYVAEVKKADVLKNDLKFAVIDINDRLLEAAVISDESSLDYATLGC